MKQTNNIFPAIILGAAMIIAAMIFAHATRYQVVDNYMVVDRWTGQAIKIELVDAFKK